MLSASLSFAATLFLLLSIVEAAPLNGPSVALGDATFIGKNHGRVSKFLGIPFAHAPIGDLRWRLPQPVLNYTQGRHDATNFGPSCPQQRNPIPLPIGVANDFINQFVNVISDIITPESEDCLTVNVVKPASATPNSKLPVLVWIYGGGFSSGSSSLFIYDGKTMVEKSMLMGEPVIFVSLNYRMSVWGFLASQEVKDAGIGNIGLQDQREALRWIQRNIVQFGGDPSKVTIWGESAGAISIAMQMIANNGNHENLFRGVFMQSGAVLPIGDITNGQPEFDDIIQQVGCASSEDKIACLRATPFEKIRDIARKSRGIFDYTTLVPAWFPRVDGVFIKDTAQEAVVAGRIANVPFITGNTDDEGTIFTLPLLNITTSAQAVHYLRTNYFTQVTEEEARQLIGFYPDNEWLGAPHDTGPFNALTPQFKRLAAFQGDVVFQAPRRLLLESAKAKRWSYMFKRGKLIPYLGSFHGSDLLHIWGLGEAELQSYLINFTNHLNPNGNRSRYGLINWPEWTPTGKTILELRDALIFDCGLAKDTVREKEISYLKELSLKYPLGGRIRGPIGA